MNWRGSVKGFMEDVFVATAVSLVVLIGIVRTRSAHEDGHLTIMAEVAESVLHYYEDRYPGDSRPRAFIEAKKKKATGDIGRCEYRVARAGAFNAYLQASRGVGADLSGAAALDSAAAAYRENLTGVVDAAEWADHWGARAAGADGTMVN